MLDTLTHGHASVRLDLDDLETLVRQRTACRVRFLDVRLVCGNVLELRGLSPTWHLKAVAGAALCYAAPQDMHVANLIEVAD